MISKDNASHITFMIEHPHAGSNPATDQINLFSWQGSGIDSLRESHLGIQLPDEAVIDDRAGFADGLERDLFLVQLNQHKVIVFIIAGGADFAIGFDVAAPNFAGAAADKMLNTVLR